MNQPINGYLQAYNRDVSIMGVGRRGCLVAFKTGPLAQSLQPVPFDAISWKSPDWFEPDK